ncbi:hypothetical protein [Nonomuraea sp. NPDC049141]
MDLVHGAGCQPVTPLEISGAFDSMGMDAGQLLAAEIETMVAAADAR